MIRTNDRRTANRKRTHDAILAAARALVDEHQDADFSFEEIAIRADVSRRTVFNHFPTRDDLTLALCSDVLASVVTDFSRFVAEAPLKTSSRDDYFDALDGALATTDLPNAIQTIVTILPKHVPEERTNLIMRQALTLLDEVIRNETRRRLPQASTFQVDLFVGALVNGLATASSLWLACDSGSESATRDEWRTYLDTVISQLRGGYLT